VTRLMGTLNRCLLPSTVVSGLSDFTVHALNENVNGRAGVSLILRGLSGLCIVLLCGFKNVDRQSNHERSRPFAAG
jgi:hypothetical protein